MSKLFAIDPGTTHSAWLLYDPDGGGQIIGGFGKEENSIVMQRIVEMAPHFELLAVEQMSGYIAPWSEQTSIGKEILATCVWSGRFIERADSVGKEHVMMLRRAISGHLCPGSKSYKDKDVRAALIKRFGDPGTKKEPGLLFGVTRDVWSALALAVAFSDMNIPAKVKPVPQQPSFGI
jgi:hypothetical protein